MRVAPQDLTPSKRPISEHISLKETLFIQTVCDYIITNLIPPNDIDWDLNTWMTLHYHEINIVTEVYLCSSPAGSVRGLVTQSKSKSVWFLSGPLSLYIPTCRFVLLGFCFVAKCQSTLYVLGKYSSTETHSRSIFYVDGNPLGSCVWMEYSEQWQ